MTDRPTKLAAQIAALGITPGCALASAANVDLSEIQAAIAGEKTLRLEQAERVASVLGCRVVDILETPLPRRVYVAGSVTGGGENYRRAFVDAAETLRAKGYDVVDPTAVTAALPREHMTRRELMLLGATLLTTCDAVCLLPNWDESAGATMERALALAANIPVHDLATFAESDAVTRDDTEPDNCVARVTTPLGTMKVLISDDPDHPGVLVDIELPDGTTGALSLTEFTADDADETPKLVTRTWSHVRDDAASVETTHEGIDA